MGETTRECVEPDCHELAGTPWTPYWCIKHDEERRQRITESLNEIAKRLHEQEQGPT